jgi:hypothetical protein
LLSTSIGKCYFCTISLSLHQINYFSISSFLLNTMHMNGHFVISCPFLLIKFLYKSPTMLPYSYRILWNQNPSFLLSKISKILFNICIGQTIKLQMLATSFILLVMTNPYSTFSPPLLIYPCMHPSSGYNPHSKIQILRLACIHHPYPSPTFKTLLKLHQITPLTYPAPSLISGRNVL